MDSRCFEISPIPSNCFSALTPAGRSLGRSSGSEEKGSGNQVNGF
jgi:hypothetical protein